MMLEGRRCSRVTQRRWRQAQQQPPAWQFMAFTEEKVRELCGPPLHNLPPPSQAREGDRHVQRRGVIAGEGWGAAAKAED